jgi:hypothetical protein
MVRSRSRVTVSLATDTKQVHLQIGPKTYSLSLSKAFSVAHEFMCRKNYTAASQVCEALVQSGSLGPRATIMLACCKAGLKDYFSCNELLRSLFAAQDTPVAEGLHTAFVYGRLGMRSDAIRELAKVADDRPDLPTVCLLLGDLFAAVGHNDKAVQCWRLAIQRDQRDGSVAREAQKGLSILLKQSQSPSQNAAPGNGRLNGMPQQ